MRKLKNVVLAYARNNKFVFSVLVVITKLTNASIYQQRLWKNRFEDEYLDSLQKPHVVLAGLFKGMIYPRLESYGSELAPKILGTYEYEIQDKLKTFMDFAPNNVLDIGCAEGYYAVGIGMKLNKSRILAFDVSKKAISLCKNLASRNGVSNIDYKEKCDSSYIADFPFQKNDLIICDTEGYEWLLFNETNVQNLRNCNLIIELHNSENHSRANFINLFKNTHQIEIFQYKKRIDFQCELLEGMDMTKKSYILSECRNGILNEGSQEWLVLQAKVEF
jgi:precorrin-6B methylase 2